MSTGHRINFDPGDVLRGGALIKDPGTGGTIDLKGRDFGVVRGFGAGTYKLPNIADKQVGTVVRVVADGAQTWQNAAASTVAVLASGQVALFVAESTSAWDTLTTNAGDVVYSDSNDYTTASQVNDALDELYNSYLTTGHVDIPLNSFREVDADGDVGNLAAAGGILASDSTPFLEGVGTTNANRIGWATGNVDRISATVSLPADFDGGQPATLEFIVASAGTTNSFNTAAVVTNWDGGADVADTLTDTATTTVKAAPATIAAADIPAAPLTVTISLTPPTHATDILYVYGCRLRYTRAIQTP